MATCGGCTTTWTGMRIAHCGSCHETFSTVAHFDRHRSPRGPRGACLVPTSLLYGPESARAGESLLKLDSRAVWTDNSTRPEGIGEQDLSGCPYYRGTGTCGGGGDCSAYGEPLCITGEPENGWPSQRRKAAK